jgi:hypothetical protein
MIMGDFVFCIFEKNSKTNSMILLVLSYVMHLNTNN